MPYPLLLQRMAANLFLFALKWKRNKTPDFVIHTGIYVDSICIVMYFIDCIQDATKSHKYRNIPFHCISLYCSYQGPPLYKMCIHCIVVVFQKYNITIMILPNFICTYHLTAQGIHLIVLLFSEITLTGLNNKDLVVVCLRIPLHCNLKE